MIFLNETKTILKMYMQTEIYIFKYQHYLFIPEFIIIRVRVSSVKVLEALIIDYTNIPFIFTIVIDTF